VDPVVMASVVVVAVAVFYRATLQFLHLVH
jgi:hypothetical protein